MHRTYQSVSSYALLPLSVIADRDEDYIAAARALFAVNSTLQARETKYSELMQVGHVRVSSMDGWTV